VAAARVILVSDTHLSASAPQAQANWDAVVRYVGACAPDLVVHLGDLSLDGARDAADLRHGRTQLDRLPAAWRAVPGNHDIGDNPWPGAPRAAPWTPPGISGGSTSSAPTTGR
jgi:3',5'-cyclic-AMP phosphodiesterase